MTKWFGKVGFEHSTEETSPSVFTEKIVERSYYGDVLEWGRQMQGGEGVYDDITVTNQLSILADPYALDHFSSMRYAEMGGAKWKVTGVKVQFPRLILTLGGIYHGNATTENR